MSETKCVICLGTGKRQVPTGAKGRATFNCQQCEGRGHTTSDNTSDLMGVSIAHPDAIASAVYTNWNTEHGFVPDAKTLQGADARRQLIRMISEAIEKARKDARDE